MTNFLDAIPQAVATIVASVANHLAMNPDAARAESMKHVVELTDQLTRTMTKALRESANNPLT